jgi:hypothetical protein
MKQKELYFIISDFDFVYEKHYYENIDIINKLNLQKNSNELVQR